MLVLIAACSGDGPTESEPGSLERDPDPPFQTDTLVYHLRPAPHGVPALITEIRVSFRNNSPDTVRILEQCQSGPRMILEREVGDAWVQAWDSAGPPCTRLYRTVPPGSGYEDTIEFFGGLLGSDHWPQFELHDLEGVYRLQWLEVVREFDPHDPSPEAHRLPLDQRISNRFILRVDP